MSALRVPSHEVSLIYLDVSRSEYYKTVLISETPFWVAGAAESMKISIIVGGWGCATGNTVPFSQSVVRDVSCGTCRACDVVRARQINSL